MATDVIANELAIRLFLFGSALLSLYEGFKVERPYSFLAWGAALLFFLSGVLLTPLAGAWPIGAAWFGRLAINPVTWLILMVLAYLLVRPRIVKAPMAGQVESRPKEDNSDVEKRLARLEHNHGNLRDHFTEMDKANEERETALRTTIAVNDRKARERHEPLETNYTAILRDYQNMRGLEARLTDMLDGLKELMQRDKETERSNLAAVQDQLKESVSRIDKALGVLFLALQAVRAREREGKLAASIEEYGNLLTKKVSDQEAFSASEWEQWESHLVTFESALGHWLDLADGWHPKVREWVNQVHPSDFANPEWGALDDYIPFGSKKVIAYQTFATKYNNWKRFNNHVHSVIELAAFGGPHSSEILQDIPGGPPTVDRAIGSFK